MLWLLVFVAATSAGRPVRAEPSHQPAGGGAVAGQLARLPWVNPARCHSACSYHPGAALVRVNNVGQPDARGRHQLDAAAVAPLQALLLAGRTAGHTMRIASGFRSYAEQGRLFRRTKEKGRAARPGHSEHQLGTAVDLRLPSTAALNWLADHALDHGFAVSYPPGKQRITGYRPEPWHVRFVGVPVSVELRRAGSTLEELFRARPDLAESGGCEDCPTAASRRPCGRTGPKGTCEGDVLVWCYEGALAMVDCAAFKQTCGQPPESPVPDCVPGAADPVPVARRPGHPPSGHLPSGRQKKSEEGD